MPLFKVWVKKVSTDFTSVLVQADDETTAEDLAMAFVQEDMDADDWEPGNVEDELEVNEVEEVAGSTEVPDVVHDEDES